MERRKALWLIGSLAASAAVVINGDRFLDEIVKGITPSIKNELPIQDPNFNQLVNILLPDTILSIYEEQIHSTPENENRFISHKHPNNTPTDASYWTKRKDKNNAELRKLDDLLKIGFFENADLATKNMLQRGYAYSCLPSFVGENQISYIFGKVIEDKKIKNSDFGDNNEKRVIVYQEITPTFEDYTNTFNLFGRHVLSGIDLIFINKTGIKRYVDSVFELGYILGLQKKSKSGEKLNFYEVMVLKEYESAGNTDAISERLTKAMTHHEVSHSPNEGESVKGEVTAQLIQMYYQPFLTLAILEESSNRDATQGKVYRNSAKRIFDIFKREGYSKEDLMNMDEKSINKIVERIMISH